MCKRFLPGLMIVWSALAGPPPDAHHLPDAHNVMARSVKLVEANWKEAPNYSFIRSEVKSKRGSQPVQITYEVLMIEGSPYLKIIGEDGHPILAHRAQEEERKLQQERAEREKESAQERRRRVAKYTEGRNRDRAMLAELCDAFEYTAAGEDRIGKDAVWVLQGKPRPGYVAKTREAKVLSGMNVRFWIDKSSYQWLRVEAEVIQPVSLYGAIAKVGPGTKFVLEQEEVTPGVWLPKRFSMHVKASALGFINKDSLQDEVYTNYRLAAPLAAAPERARETGGASEREATGLR